MRSPRTTDPRWPSRAALLGALALLTAPAAPAEPAATAGEADPSAPLPEADLNARREALRTRIFEPLILEAMSFRFIFERRTSSFTIEDRRTGVGWHSPLSRKGFAAVHLAGGGSLPVDIADDLKSQEKEIRFRGRSTKGELPEVRFKLSVLEPLVGLEIAFEVPQAEEGRVRGVTVLEGGPWVADADGGGAVLPAGLGEWAAVEKGPDFRRRFRRSDAPWTGVPSDPEPATMAALGLVRGSAALLIAWDSLAAEVEVRRGPAESPAFPGRSGLGATIQLPGPRGSVRLFPLGKGDAIEIAHSYRQLAGRERKIVNLRARLAGREGLQSFLGAAILRPRVPGPGGRSPADVAALAARWRKDLEIDEGLVVLDDPGEAGGEALADCSRRVKALGWLFGISLEEAAASPEALDRLKERAAPDLVLITGGAGTAPAPADSKAEAAAAALGERLRTTFGIAGTDGAGEGRVAGFGYLEGLLDHKALHPRGDRVFPLFPFAYGHAARIAVRPEDAVTLDQPERLLAHLSLGEVPIYSLDDPPPAPGGSSAAGGGPGGDPRRCLARSDGGWCEGKGLSAREVFVKNTYEVLSQVARFRFRHPLLFRRSLDPQGDVEETWFGEDLRIVVNYGDTEYVDREGDFKLPPSGFWVQYPYFHAFHATRAHGVDYPIPALFTVRSLEGKMYLRAEAVRIWHGFGSSRIVIGGRSFDVPRESVVKVW